MKVTRTVFAAVMLAAVTTALVLAALSWRDAYRARHEAPPPAVEVAER